MFHFTQLRNRIFIDKMAYGGSVVAAVSKVELSISCTKLKNLDVLSKSDPMCVIYVKRGRDWDKIARTEMVKDNLNPKVCCESRVLGLLHAAAYFVAVCKDNCHGLLL